MNSLHSGFLNEQINRITTPNWRELEAAEEYGLGAEFFGLDVIQFGEFGGGGAYPLTNKPEARIGDETASLLFRRVLARGACVF